MKNAQLLSLLRDISSSFFYLLLHVYLFFFFFIEEPRAIFFLSFVSDYSSMKMGKEKKNAKGQQGFCF